MIRIFSCVLLSLFLTVGSAGAQVLQGQPNFASFGPYAKLDGRAYVGPDGTHVRWYMSGAGATMVSETRTANGDLDNIHVIKPAAGGSLLMLRSGYCPGDVCGQVGSITDGVVTWREPAAIGGHAGGYLNVRMWLEENDSVLATQIADPAPYAGGAPTVQAPYRLTLVDPPQMSPQLMAQSESLVSQLESRVDVEVANVLGKQLATRLAQDNAMEARRRSSERVQSFNRLMGSVNSVLSEANAGGYAEAQANLDASVANIQAAAAIERQQQALAQQQEQARAAEEQRKKLAANARWVAEKEQAAAEYRSGQVDAAAAPAPSQSAVRQSPDSAGSSPAESKTSGEAMTFLLQVSVDAIINRMNGTCYSNLVTIPGPPGWPVLDHTNDRKAAALVDAYKAGFLAQCGQAGPVRSGNFSYIWNARGSESRLADEFARQQRNQMFQVQVSP